MDNLVGLHLPMQQPIYRSWLVALAPISVSVLTIILMTTLRGSVSQHKVARLDRGRRCRCPVVPTLTGSADDDTVRRGTTWCGRIRGQTRTTPAEYGICRNPAGRLLLYYGLAPGGISQQLGQLVLSLLCCWRQRIRNKNLTSTSHARHVP